MVNSDLGFTILCRFCGDYLSYVDREDLVDRGGIILKLPKHNDNEIREYFVCENCCKCIRKIMGEK